MIFRMVSLSAWWTKGVAVAFMYCSIRVLARVVARNNVVASSGWSDEGFKKERKEKKNSWLDDSMSSPEVPDLMIFVEKTFLDHAFVMYCPVLKISQKSLCLKSSTMTSNQ